MFFLRSIRLRLIVYVTSVFIIASMAIFFITESELRKIIDESQEELYMERIDSILNILDKTDIRLQKTGLSQAYIHDFQKTAIQRLSESQYHENANVRYPIIFDDSEELLMHPFLTGNHLFTPRAVQC